MLETLRKIELLIPLHLIGERRVPITCHEVMISLSLDWMREASGCRKLDENSFRTSFFSSFFLLIYLYLDFTNSLPFGSEFSSSLRCRSSVRTEYLVKLLRLCWIASGDRIHPSYIRTVNHDIEPASFWNSSYR